MSDNSTLSKLLRRTDKKITESANLLTALYRKILADRNIHDEARWYSLFNRMVKDPRANVPDSKASIAQFRSNLVREVGKTTMSWLYFERAIRIFRPIKIKLTIEMFYMDGSSSKHVVDTETEFMRPLEDIADPEEIKKFKESLKDK